MDAGQRPLDPQPPAATAAPEGPAASPRAIVVPVNDLRAANIRDALLWGAAFVPFLALALLPRRAQLNKLRGEIVSLSRQSSKQSRANLDALALLRQSQDDGLRELRERLLENGEMLRKLEVLSSQSFLRHDAVLADVKVTIADAAVARDHENDNRAAIEQAALDALEEARNHLASSRRYVTSLACPNCND